MESRTQSALRTLNFIALTAVVLLMPVYAHADTYSQTFEDAGPSWASQCPNITGVTSGSAYAGTYKLRGNAATCLPNVGTVSVTASSTISWYMDPLFNFGEGFCIYDGNKMFGVTARNATTDIYIAGTTSCDDNGATLLGTDNASYNLIELEIGANRTVIARANGGAWKYVGVMTGDYFGFKNNSNNIADIDNISVSQFTGGYYSSQAEGITAITAPSNNSTTANNTPAFSYTYYTTHAYDRAGIRLVDQTTGQTINTSSSSSTISSTGSHSYSQYVGVTSGHLYAWQPVLYDTAGTLTPIYGARYTFFAVTTNQYQSLPISLNTNPFATSSIYSQNSGLVASSSASSTNYTQNFTFAASSSLGLCFAYFPDEIREKMSIKFPFSYLCDIQTLISEMVNGDGNARGNLQIGLGNVGTTTLIDKQAVSQIGAVQEIKRVSGYAMYLATALMTLWAITRIL